MDDQKLCQDVYCPPWEELTLVVSDEPYVPGAFAAYVEDYYGVTVDEMAHSLGVCRDCISTLPSRPQRK